MDFLIKQDFGVLPKIKEKKDEIIKNILEYDGDITTYDILKDYITLDRLYKINKFDKINEYKRYKKKILEKYNYIFEDEENYKKYIDFTIENNIILRYPNIYPLQNPVKIKENLLLYNASIINNQKGLNYYASQCPIEGNDTCFFLKMLIDNNIQLVCIPASFDDSSKMFRWFPTTTENIIYEYPDPDFHLKYELKCETINNKVGELEDKFGNIKNYIYSYGIKITDIISEKEHSIKILNYIGWPDMDVPEDRNLLFTYMYRIYKHIITFGLKNILVHCSAGVGRTGTVLCCIELLDYINNYIFDFDKKEFKIQFDENKLIKNLYIILINFIYYLRLHRPDMVQKLDQFDAIKEFIFNLITKCKEKYNFSQLQQKQQLQKITVQSPKPDIQFDGYNPIFRKHLDDPF